MPPRGAVNPGHAGDGLVRDRDGRQYVAIHPIYSASNAARRRVLACRVVVCLLSLVVLALAVAGQIVPYCYVAKSPKKDDVEYFSAWTEKRVRKGRTSKSELRDDNAGEAALAVLTAVFGLVAFVLAAVFAAHWSRDEAARRREEDANRRLQAAYGAERDSRDATSSDTSAANARHPRHDHHEHRGDDAVAANGRAKQRQDECDSFPYANSRVINDGRVCAVPHEVREARRRRRDRDLGIATFSMLVCAALCALVTFALMAHYYTEEVLDDDDTTALDAGFILFVVAMAVGLLAFVVLAIPAATLLYLCCPPAVEESQLMVLRGAVDDAAARRGGDREMTEMSAAPTQAARQIAPMVPLRSNSNDGDTTKKPQHPQQQYPQHPQQQYPQQQQQQQQQQQSQHHDAPPPQYNAAGYPYHHGYTHGGGGGGADGATVAQGIPVALPGPAMSTLPPAATSQPAGGYYHMPSQPTDATAPSNRESEYPTGAYYASPPQLFNVNKGGKSTD